MSASGSSTATRRARNRRPVSRTGARCARPSDHQDRASAGRASRSVTSARISDGVSRLQADEASAAAYGKALIRPKPAVVVRMAACPDRHAGRRGAISVARTASSGGARTRPATSLSLPVSGPGKAALSRWSLMISRARATTVDGWPSQANVIPRDMFTVEKITP
ncbi:hypothetical protein Aoc01nite_56860 [Actinoplanes octamycinicus]|nr:hypothetical protein Aoc01nite_56860 [Actinoplanes octamycinicus]